MHIDDIARLTTLLPVILYFLLKRKNKVLQVIVFFNSFYLAFDFIYYALRNFNRDFSDYFNLFYVPLEYLIIYYCFKLLYKSKPLLSFLNYTFAIFLFFWIISSYFIPVSAFNSVLNGLESLIVIILTFLYFYEEIKNPQSLFIYSQAHFWAIIGFFLFFSGSFFVFLYKQAHKEEELFLEQYSYIHSSFFILRNLLFTVAQIVTPEKVSVSNKRSSFT